LKAQSAAFLAKARGLLADAQKMLDVELAEAAGRTAYLAGFHAAQALIFETHDRVFKTHTGVRAEFARLVKGDATIDLDLRSFLGLAYQLKAIADHEAGPGAKVSEESARSALLTARRFVDHLEAIISSREPDAD